MDSFQNAIQSDGIEQDTPVLINAGIRNGEFTVLWSVSEPGYYAALSLNGHTGTASSIGFYDQRCPNDHCTETTQITCRFTTGMKMSCGDIGPDFPSNPEIDVTALVDQLPINRYLVLQVCRSDLTDCNSEHRAIQLQ